MEKVHVLIRDDLGDVVEIVYLLIDLFTIFDTADVETPVFLAISAMGIPYPEKNLIVIRNRTLAYYNVYMLCEVLDYVKFVSCLR